MRNLKGLKIKIQERLGNRADWLFDHVRLVGKQSNMNEKRRQIKHEMEDEALGWVDNLNCEECP